MITGLNTKVSIKAVERLTVYRRILMGSGLDINPYIYSHEIAKEAGVSSAMVRRDIMELGYEGSPSRGYEKADLLDHIARLLDDPEGTKVALVGVGHLGRAILNYFMGHRPNLTVVAAFDADTQKVDRVIHGIRCYRVEDLTRIVKEQQIGMGVITVPGSYAQDVADALIKGGVTGIVNFAPQSLRVPEGVHISTLDITTTFETTAFLSRNL